MKYEIAEMFSGFILKVVFRNALLLSVVALTFSLHEVLRTYFDNVHQRCEHPLSYLSYDSINCNYKFLSESELLYKIEML